MQKSFIDRLFPQPRRPLLPQYDVSDTSSIQLDEPPPRIKLRDGSPPNSPQTTSSNSSRQLKLTPLSASLINHDDPFLPIERAAKTLQSNIQSFLNRQADALRDRLSNTDGDETTSAGSRTPTPSLVTPSRNLNSSVTIPIRQPTQKKVTLRGARKGLARSMHDFAALREEELKIIQAESAARQDALQRVKDLEDQKEAVQSQIQSMETNVSTENATALRSEARNVQNEIAELENRLMELKVRHRHLINQAEQLESTVDSEISSFRGTLSEIDKETRKFLRRPPVNHSLAGRSGLGSETNMYLLKPERRTLGMAREQWVAEGEALEKHRSEVQAEKDALASGEKIWKEAVLRINNFERLLREQLSLLRASHVSYARTEDSEQHQDSNMAASMDSSISSKQLQDELDSTIAFLQRRLSQAEEKGWNLLVCALGAELEAFGQARRLLNPSNELSPIQTQTSEGASATDSEEGDAPGSDLLIHHHNRKISDSVLSPSVTNGSLDRRDSHTSNGSNESLKATLNEFGYDSSNRSQHNSTILKRESDMKPSGTIGSSSRVRRNTDVRSESEDDDPGPDFLLSH